MTQHTWDPGHYLRYAGERGRPFVELVARIAADDPREVVDLGCGPGNLTTLLTQRWPSATVVGVDSSAEMIEAARRDTSGVDYAVADVRDWMPPRPVDVVISNATLQWVPGHLDLLERLVGHLAPGGWLAVQVPGNFGEPSHTSRTEIAARPEYAEHTRGVAVPCSHDPQVYLERLVDLGCVEVDVWETTYLHVLQGPDAVFDWVSATGARPTIQALPEGLRERFVAQFKARLREEYPEGPAGVVLPFRRVFMVARRP